MDGMSKEIRKLKMLDLFSGIGGFSYAAEKLVGGYETVAFCEYDEHAQKVLRKHWPRTEIIGDIRELANDAERFRGSVDIVCGGFPCQPFSLAGVRRGDQDDRHLWPEMLRVIEAVRPRWIIGENVAGHITMGLDTVLSDLEAAGYASRCYVIPAVAADAPHRRDRCWIVGYSNSSCKSDVTLDEEMRMAGAKDVGHTSSGRRSGVDGRWSGQKFAHRCEDVADANSQRLQRQRQQSSRVGAEQYDPCDTRRWEPEPELGRVANGVRNRVHRLKQLGNSIVPQVAARILYAIREADRGKNAAQQRQSV